jgi:hypothetical protein
VTLFLPPAHSPVRGRDIFGAVWKSLSASPHALEAELEGELKRRFGASEAIATGSGTEALQIALSVGRAARGRPNASIVALPAYACYDLASAAIGADLAVTFYDLSPQTLGPDLDSVRVALNLGAEIVVAAPLFGYPIEWDSLAALVASYGALLLEDAAQGAGGRWAGTRIGALGSLSVLSFGRGKGWTGGGGGAVLARGTAVSHLRDLRTSLIPAAGRGGRAAVLTLAQWILGRPGFYGIPAGIPGLALGETVYHPPVTPREAQRFSLGLALRTAGLSAAEAHGRQTRAKELEARLADVGGISFVHPVPKANRGTSGFRYCWMALDASSPTRASRTLSESIGDIRSRSLSYRHCADTSQPPPFGRQGRPVWPKHW